MMYDYLNQPLYNSFEHCSSYHEKQPNEVQGVSNVNYVASNLTQNIPEETPFPISQVPSAVNNVHQKDGKRPVGRLVVDTSAFSVEERLIAAVWVHERKRSKTSMSQIKKDFLQRFGREPPAKNTLLVWERKLFSSGSIHDAPRPGRPVNSRKTVVQCMFVLSWSLRNAPALSLRARAAALRVPRTTLRTILHRDLRHVDANTKRPSKKNAKPSPPAPAPLLYHGYS